MANVNIDECDQNVRELILRGHVGLENLSYQLVKQRLSQGFTFNIMCVGETGIGKSTLISSLFNIKERSANWTFHKYPKVMMKSVRHNLQEKEVTLHLTVVETVGYGDQIKRDTSFEPILSYLDWQFESYLQDELNPKRQLESAQDTRIHVCLFFICPTGHNLKSLDLICLKSLDKKVNVIPLIAKADTLTRDELQNFKSTIRREMEKEDIQIYRFPTDEDPVVDEANSKFNAMMPFAVVGSTDSVVRDGNLVRGRNYPWGSVCVKNEDHCDSSKLLEAMVEINMEDLVEQTHVRHFENYRRERLQEQGIEVGTFELMDAWKVRSDELRKELQNREEKVIQGFVKEAKSFEQKLMLAEKTMVGKYRGLEQKALTEKRELDKEANLLSLEIASFKKLKIEKGLTKTNNLNNTDN